LTGAPPALTVAFTFAREGQDMIKLYQFAPAFGLPNASPFCMKLETYLRMAGLPYEAVNDGNVLKAPKRKLPYIDDGGTIVADSSFIIDYLKTRYGDPLDGALSAFERAQATAFQRLMEEDLYWAVVQTRWDDAAGWIKTRQAFFGALPVPLRWLLPPLARRGLLAEMRGHGMGRHSVDEIHAIGQRDITAVADFLADKPFMLGSQPTSLDATAYAFLANLLWAPVDSALLRCAQGRPTLEIYCRRMKARYFA
jgi:glutathione S-transferase